MNRIIQTSINLLFPQRCVVCDEPAPFGKLICEKCKGKLEYIREPRCMKCGKALREEKEYCGDCLKIQHKFKQGKVLYDYGSMSDSLFRFKYEGRREYARFYARDLYVHFKPWLRAIAPDALIPVPIHYKRQNKRGYNQSYELAKELSFISQIPVKKDYLIRSVNTSPLRNLNPQERRKNLKNAFKMGKNDVKLSTIVILDDIYTTGSTMDAITEIILQYNPCDVYFMCLASGRGI